MNVGNFLKRIAVVLFIISFISLVICGVNSMSSYAPVLTFGTWFALLLASGMSCLTIYAFGEVVDRIVSIEEYMRYYRYKETKDK